jgi:C4-dicarboxylate transporter DctQ subunit
MFKKINAFLDGLFAFLNGIGSSLILGVVLFVCVSVFFRYLFHRPISWMIQITEYSLLVVVFLGAAYLLKLDGHVSIDLLVTNLKPRTQHLVNFITSLACILGCAVIVWYGFKTCLDLFQRGILVMEEVQIPKYLIEALIPGTFFLMLIQFIRRAVEFYHNWRALGVKKGQQLSEMTPGTPVS